LKAFATERGLDFLNGDYEPGLKATVHFTSWLKDIDVVNAGMDIIALSSLNEGTPVSLIEAQAAGKPIVSTKVGGISNIVLKNETALLSQNNNEASFSRNLLKLVEEDDLRLKMGLKGWEFVNEKFHYSRLVKDMSNLYHKLLA
jgi:glycosyltransferase involved in cell wall biosynthesis